MGQPLYIVSRLTSNFVERKTHLSVSCNCRSLRIIQILQKVSCILPKSQKIKQRKNEQWHMILLEPGTAFTSNIALRAWPRERPKSFLKKAVWVVFARSPLKSESELDVNFQRIFVRFKIPLNSSSRPRQSFLKKLCRTSYLGIVPALQLQASRFLRLLIF